MLAIAINYFIFKQGAAGMKSGIELLNTEAKVSAYTIRVLDGKGVDKKDIKSVYGKYLTNAVKRGSFNLLRKLRFFLNWKLRLINGLFQCRRYI